MSNQSRQLILILGYAGTIFLSAFLLFQVQPLISKYILPWFGGTPAVWTTCMLFFQALLFLGYAYAHFTTAHCSPRMQGILHVLLLGLAVATLPITPDAGWKPDGHENPTLRILLLLSLTVGVPFFVLSTTGPLLQRWFSITSPGASPYRLYALSNVGSLLALISYPFAFEPAFATHVQTKLWSFAFGAFALSCGVLSLRMSRQSDPRQHRVESTVVVPKPTLGDRLLWFGLAMAASVMLLATTNQVCLDVAAVPFLWVMPLTIYLVSFILCFDSDRWYSRRMFAVALGVSMVTVTKIMLHNAGVSLFGQVTVYFMGLFFCAMVCHGELAKLKPHPRYLTMFYLIVAAGGAGGGLFVGIVAPLIFPSYLELHFGILACCLLTLAIFFRDKDWVLYQGRPVAVWGLLLLAIVGLARALAVQAEANISDTIDMSRNFYGVLRVREDDVDDPDKHCLKLFHGRIEHGKQFVAEGRRRLPTAYFGPESGVGLVLREPSATPRRVGIVGLGVGTMAAYAQKGDYYRYYEINPEVTRLAYEHFSFLEDSLGEVEVITGDARLSMEIEDHQAFDVIVLDAFSGDAIPAHLLTVEAFEVYRQHLVPDGILAVHISNKHFDLRPVIMGAAELHEMYAMFVRPPGDPEAGTHQSTWGLLARDPRLLSDPRYHTHALSDELEPIGWTDDASNLFQVLR